MSTLDLLRGNLRGTLLAPGDAGFDDARQAWNVAIDQHPHAVVHVLDADDVVAVIKWARATGQHVTTQPNGHGTSGNAAGSILLRTGRLDAIEVDASARIARVGAGVSWGQLQAVAGPLGLTGLAGSSPVVSVAGLALGGGLSWFSRKWGWAADSIRSLDVVTAEGERLHVDASHEPDLFWALRGGGGDFAIVTAIELELHAVPALFGGRMIWPAEQAPAVLRTFRRLSTDAPDELTMWVDMLNIPGMDPCVAVDVTFLGSADAASDLLEPFRRLDGCQGDDCRPIAITELGSIAAEPTEPTPGVARAVLLRDLDDLASAAITSVPLDPLMSVQVRHLGGALARSSSGSCGTLDEPFCVYMFGSPAGTSAEAPIRSRQALLARSLAHVASRRTPFTFLATDQSSSDAFDRTTLGRLQQVKADRDPRATIRSNFPVHGVTRESVAPSLAPPAQGAASRPSQSAVR